DFVCVWPFVPTRPKVTVKLDPLRSMFQNLFDFSSVKVNSRIVGSGGERGKPTANGKRIARRVQWSCRNFTRRTTNDRQRSAARRRPPRRTASARVRAGFAGRVAARQARSRDPRTSGGV